MTPTTWPPPNPTDVYDEETLSRVTSAIRENKRLRIELARAQEEIMKLRDQLVELQDLWNAGKEREM